MKKKIIFFVCILLLIILIGCIGFYLLSRTAKNPKKLDINSDLVQKLYNQVNPSDDGDILENLYKSVNGFNNEYIIATGIKNYLNKQDKEVQIIPQKEVENNIKEIFGNNISYTDQDTYIKSYPYCGFYYKKENDNYEFIPGCGGSMFQIFRRKITNAEENSKELIIYEKSIYIFNDWNDLDRNISIYNNIIEKKLIKNYHQSSNEPLNIEINDYLNDASIYKYIFEKNGSNYLFKKLELVK